VPGIDTLLKGAVSSLAKDKITNTLTPTQMELASFILSPQYYMAEKGVNKIAEILGYGSEWKNTNDASKNLNEYYKQLMRDTIGDALPNTIGDIVRATPRVSEADKAPAGIYTAWDPETESWKQQQSSRPVVASDPAVFENFLRELNAGSNQEVGPLEEYHQKRLDDEYDFHTSLSDFQNGMSDVAPTRSLSSQTSNTNDVVPSGYTFDASMGAVVPVTSIDSSAPTGYTFDANTGTVIPTTPAEDSTPAGYTTDTNAGVATPIDFGGTMDYSDVISGGGGKGFEREMDYGGYDPFDNYMAYVNGGQIPKGKR